MENDQRKLPKASFPKGSPDPNRAWRVANRKVFHPEDVRQMTVRRGKWNDDQIQLLEDNGMPSDSEMVLIKIPGAICGAKFKDYTVEIFGVVSSMSVDSLPYPDELYPYPGSYSHIQEPDGTNVVAHIWRRRVFLRGTEAFIEEIYNPVHGWTVMVCNVERINVDRRIRELRKLAEGSLLGIMIDRPGREPGSNELSLEQFRNLGFQAARKIGASRKTLTKGNFAKEMGISRASVYNYLDRDNDETLWRQFEVEATKARTEAMKS